MSRSFFRLGVSSPWLLPLTFSSLALFATALGCASTPSDTDGMQDGGEHDLTPVTLVGNVISTETLPDGSVVEKTDAGYTRTTSADGTVTIEAPDGTTTVMSPDGTVTTTAPDGTVTVTTKDGQTTTTRPAGGSGGAPSGSGGAVAGVGGSEQTASGGSGGGGSSSDPVWINEDGKVADDSNAFGIAGYWYAFGDGTTTDASGNPFTDGKYCISGTSTGEEGNWGAGIGIDLNGLGSEKAPYEFAGKVTGFRMKISGEIPAPARLNFVHNPDVDVSPFIEVTPSGESEVFNIAEAQIPFSWDVDNAGERVPGSTLYSLQLLAPGDSEAGPIDFCIEEFEPVYDENATPSFEGTTYINSDGFVAPESNDFGIAGPVYVISDGNSTSQTGVPFADGKYCVSGEFSGEADDWGAGIALDLSNLPGEDKGALDPSGKLAAFRLGLSGSTPGSVRVQYVLNEPQEGNQPFLVGQLNASAIYPLAWAQVPSSWEVDDAGLGVGDAVVTLQLYLDGSVAGPFDICIEELAPLGSDEVSFSGSPATGGLSGFRTFDEARLQAEYELWKSRHFNDCGDGTACIPREEDNDCISEGIGYGMLLTAAFDDQVAFDKLWGYFTKNRRSTGMMNWRTNICGSGMSDGAATDGDLDAAMALIQAGCAWGGSYAQEALTLIQAIETNAIANCSAGSVLKPGDNFGGCNETNPSYVAPAYYRVFQELSGNAVWGSLIDTGYLLLAANQTRKDGVFSDWSTETGAAATAGSHSDDFGPDASRVPWRVATDYIWNAEPRALPILDAFRSRVSSEGGPERAFAPNSMFRGASAFSAIATDAATAKEYTEAWLQTAVDDETYFPGTLRPIYLLLAAHAFSQSCE